MGTKKLVIQEETVEFAIKKGLTQLGLESKDTCIQILQREKQSILGCRPGIIAILYSEEESERALRKKAEEEFRSKFRFRLHAGQAQIMVPQELNDRSFLKDKKEKRAFILGYLREHQIEDPDIQLIDSLCDSQSKEYTFTTVKVIETLPLNQEGALIHLYLFPDEMRCQSIIFHHGQVAEEDVLRVLKDRCITKGILLNNISSVLANRYTGFFDIARGSPAVDDAPGNIERFFLEDEYREFAKMMEKLTIGTSHIKEINLAEKNQLLLRLGEIKEGTDGFTVTGKTLAKKQLLDIKSGIKPGKNVYFSDNQREVFSKVSGHIKWVPESGVIDVEPIHYIDGNVDYREGNILGFVGKVVIKGDVKPKFTVVAEGDIEIHGSVEDATIKSTHGNVTVLASIIHNTEGSVQAAGSVHVNIATNAYIKAKTILVQKEAMNSKLEASEDCLAIGTPGAIIGGEVRVKRLLKANTIGSESCVPTKLFVGDVSELKRRLRTLHQQITKQTGELKSLKQVLTILKSRKNLSALTESQEKQFNSAYQEILLIERSIETAQDEEAKINEDIESRRQARLEILKTLHPQCDVHIFEGFFIPDTPEQRTGFRCVDGEITRYPLV